MDILKYFLTLVKSSKYCKLLKLTDYLSIEKHNEDLYFCICSEGSLSAKIPLTNIYTSYEDKKIIVNESIHISTSDDLQSLEFTLNSEFSENKTGELSPELLTKLITDGKLNITIDTKEDIIKFEGNKKVSVGPLLVSIDPDKLMYMRSDEGVTIAFDNVGVKIPSGSLVTVSLIEYVWGGPTPSL